MAIRANYAAGGTAVVAASVALVFAVVMTNSALLGDARGVALGAKSVVVEATPEPLESAEQAIGPGKVAGNESAPKDVLEIVTVADVEPVNNMASAPATAFVPAAKSAASVPAATTATSIKGAESSQPSADDSRSEKASHRNKADDAKVSKTGPAKKQKSSVRTDARQSDASAKDRHHERKNPSRDSPDRRDR